MAQLSIFFKFRQSLIGWVLCLMAFLGVCLLSRPALAGNDCIRIHDPDYQEGDQHFAVISINGDSENKFCQLRTAYRMVPVLGENGDSLELQDWLRSAFAANQGKSSTVKRGCVPLPGKKPPADATEEEKLFCKDGVVHYYGLTSSRNGRVNIYIPTTRWYTELESKTTTAKKACSVLESIPDKSIVVEQALAQCRKAKAIQAAPHADDDAKIRVETIGTLRDALTDKDSKINDQKAEIAVLTTDLNVARTPHPFKPNGWLLVTVVLGALVALVATHDVVSKKDLKSQLVANSYELEQLRLGMEQASRDTVLAGELNVAKYGVELEKAGKEAEIEKLKKELAEARAETERQHNLHLEVVTKLRAQASEEAKQQAEALKQADQANGGLKSLIGEIKSKLDDANSELTDLKKKYGELELECIGYLAVIDTHEGNLIELVKRLNEAYDELDILEGVSPERERHTYQKDPEIQRKLASLRPPPMLAENDESSTSSGNNETSSGLPSNVHQLFRNSVIPAVGMRPSLLPVEVGNDSRMDEEVRVLRECVTQVIRRLGGASSVPEGTQASVLASYLNEALAASGH